MIGRTNTSAGVSTQDQVLDLSLVNNTMVVVPTNGYGAMSSVTINIPETAIAENIRAGVLIGGILGSYTGQPVSDTYAGLSGEYIEYDEASGTKGITIMPFQVDGGSIINSAEGTEDNLTIIFRD